MVAKISTGGNMFGALAYNHAFITHAAADANVVAAAKEEAAQYGSFETVEETQAGCTVSCHCGPNTLGILFVRK